MKHYVTLIYTAVKSYSLDSLVKGTVLEISKISTKSCLLVLTITVLMLHRSNTICEIAAFTNLQGKRVRWSLAFG